MSVRRRCASRKDDEPDQTFFFDELTCLPFFGPAEA
jgi:hypothetical protein